MLYGLMIVAFFLTAMFFFLGKGVLQLQYLMNYYLYSYHLLER